MSGEVQWQRPVMTQILEAYDRQNYLDNENDDSSDASDEGQLRAMPTKAAVVAAGRYDLHHAITYWGGYKQVGGYIQASQSCSSSPNNCATHARTQFFCVTRGLIRVVLGWSGVTARHARSGGMQQPRDMHS